MNDENSRREADGGKETEQTPHKRRVRYKGTHPRNYSEKYKELHPSVSGKSWIFWRSVRDRWDWMQRWGTEDTRRRCWNV